MFQLAGSAAFASAQAQDRYDPRQPFPNDRNDRKDGDTRMPDGKSQQIAIAKDAHKQALEEAKKMLALAEELKTELEKSGAYVVPLNTMKKAEEIEKLARRIRGRLRS